MLSLPFLLPLLSTASLLVKAHGGGHAGENYDSHGADDESLGYAERHMRSEHHIDAFDPEAFFALHDLNHDGVLDKAEIEAIYGLHHDISKSNSASDDTHSAMAKTVVDKVLSIMDRDNDGFLTLSEFLAAGGSISLPDFKGFEELGHHYDEESEYFLHHEERYHNTPETQTDEAYNHPEDIAHFEHHEAIESTEDDRIQKFVEGETETHSDLPHDAKVAAANNRGSSPGASAAVEPPKLSRQEELRNERILAETEDEPYGMGDKGYVRPRTPRDKLRRNTPYKYKFRRTPKEF
ncbi:EF-hand domain pair [Phaffia rhodozyma]|uniref:EF-hand domain pair n=1 Tax=Phaffia rhodozyma TaxID=264483 RepID=A0A0F7SS17_PHARH|nr:EF-hand domain pair [Phaffia rhodozyma]